MSRCRLYLQLRPRGLRRHRVQRRKQESLYRYQEAFRMRHLQGNKSNYLLEPFLVDLSLFSSARKWDCEEENKSVS